MTTGHDARKQIHHKLSNKTCFFDSSKKKISNQAIENRLDEIVDNFCDNWTKMLTKDQIRVYSNSFSSHNCSDIFKKFNDCVSGNFFT